MSAARPLVVPPDPNTTDHFVYLHMDWRDFEKLLEIRGERPVPRITYLDKHAPCKIFTGGGSAMPRYGAAEADRP